MQIKNMKEAISTANEIERYESAAKKLKEKLKIFVEANGPVDTGESIWSISKGISWVFSGESLKEFAATELLTMLGVNPWNYLSIASAELKALVKLGLEESTLKKYGTPKITNRFASKKSPKGGC